MEFSIQEIQEVQKKVQEKHTEYNLMKRDLINKKNTLKSLQEKLIDIEKARGIFQEASLETQSFLEEHISSTVSNALAAVFEDPYEFVVHFVERRNSTECDLMFRKNNHEYFPLDSCGHGAADVASVALRVAYLLMDPNARKILILDEPFRQLSRDLQPSAAVMISEISKNPDVGIQFIISTHNQDIIDIADKSFETSMINRKSKITVV